MDRIYLYVPPEEYAEVKASGACWDNDSKRWYIAGDTAPAAFSRWVGDEKGEAQFSITSDEAFVASAQVSCLKCHEPIEVICIHCKSGVDSEVGVAMTQFTLSNIWEMDSALAKQLERWPYFRRGMGAESEEENFVNHCPNCGAMQDDYLLHSEPGDVFFGLAHGTPGSVEFTPLAGRIQVNGDYGFEV